MSLEQALKENTEAMASLVKANKELNDAIHALVAVMCNAPPATRATPIDLAVDVATAAKVDANTVRAIKTAIEQASAEVAPEEKKSDSTSSTETPADTAAVRYDDLKKAFLDLSNAKGREACVALLSKFGAQKLPQVTEAQYAEMFADIQKAMA